MQIDYLIVGQGICGTWLSFYLSRAGKSFLVIDDNFKNSSSKIAAGIINPVTGRRHVTVWMAEEILPFAREAYTEMGNMLGMNAISKKDIIDFFPSPQMRLSFLNRIAEGSTYVNHYPDQDQFMQIFNYELGCGKISPVYTAHLEIVLPAWQKKLKINKQFLEEDFEINELNISADSIYYKDINASKIIFCDGMNCTRNPYFKKLPFAPNKGEVLLVEIPSLPNDLMYKKGMILAPLATPGLWWLGSSYAWEFDHANPTNKFRESTQQFLKNWLKIPFKIIDHLSGIRPATLERRPFVGLHPLYPSMGIFNGMGTKGCSLAPFFANQFVDHILYNNPIAPEADIKRFSKILMK